LPGRRRHTQIQLIHLKTPPYDSLIHEHVSMVFDHSQTHSAARRRQWTRRVPLLPGERCGVKGPQCLISSHAVKLSVMPCIALDKVKCLGMIMLKHTMTTADC